MSAGRAFPFLVAIALAGGGAGVLYAVLTRGSSYLAGGIYGSSIAVFISGFERGLLLPRVRAAARSWPTPLSIPAMEAVTVMLAIVGYVLGGIVTWLLALTPDGLTKVVVPTPLTLVYALLIAAVLVTLTRVRDLVGHEVFTSLLIGRYHRPIEERRIFLFLDVVGSSAFARQHGDLRAQAYLGAIFAAIADPVLQHKGAVDDYVGDMVMITWPEARGLQHARCVACVVAILARIEAGRDEWLRRFGQVPCFHAALHGGAVVTAEVGIDRHKISYFGDVVNTTARIENLCRQLGAPVLLSCDLLACLPFLPPGVTAVPCGAHAIKGHERKLGVARLVIGRSAAAADPAGLTPLEPVPQNQPLRADSAP